MRVTQKILFGNFMRDINRNRSTMGNIQSDLTSGRSVRMPSQDPVSFQRSRIIGENIRKEEQFQKNISNGLRQARLAQDTLDQAIDNLIDIKGVLINGITESSDDLSRTNMADEIGGIRDTLVNSFNLSYGDRYLFGGTNSAESPFVLDDPAEPVPSPGGVANRSNGNAPEILAADGVHVQISISGEELADTPAGDLFEVIGDIEQALRDSDSEALGDHLSDIEEVIEHVTHLASGLGNHINQMEFMFEGYESSEIAQRSDISELVDTDYGQAFSDLQRTQIAYESALAVHSTMFNNTLLDYL